MLKAALERYFGFDEFRPGQARVVELVAAGASAAAIFATGSGKSLCYQLPAMLLPGLTLVVSPLLALMKDQLDFLQARGIAAARLDSSLSREEYNRVLQQARAGELKILMISVERFRNERFRLNLKQLAISLLVVDEAHCISEWGHNFRPEYLKIPLYRRDFAIAQVLLLTATATPKVIADMGTKFGIAPENVVQTGFYRPNLRLEVLAVDAAAKPAALQALLASQPAGPAIVYVTRQLTAEQVARGLSEQGLRAEAYHAGLKSEEREAIQARFMAGSLDTVVATIAFGMGIDKADIRQVVHYDLPKSIENYSQEVGRAGRDGCPARCVVLGSRDNLSVLENFVYGDTPELGGIRLLLDEILTCGGTSWEVRLNELALLTDIRLLPLKTLLVQLELRGILSPRYAYFEEYAFKFKAAPEAIVERFAGERRSFVAAILENCRSARLWTTADIAAIERASGAERSRIVRALEYFDEQGLIELSAKGVVDVYAVVVRDFDAEALVQELLAAAREREASEIGRIQQLLALFESPACLAASLSEYFGERLAQPCGQCSACAGRPFVWPAPQTSLAPLAGLARRDLLRELEAAADFELTPATCAKFLCGLATPRLSRLRAPRLKGFGALEDYPFAAVHSWLSEC